jgi:hypothetical protein
MMTFTVKIVLARAPGTREIDRDGPMELLTRTELLGFFPAHPAIREAYFGAEWEGDGLKLGRRVEDENW